MTPPLRPVPNPAERRPLWRMLPWRSTLIIGALLVGVSLLQRLPVVHHLLQSAPHWHETPCAPLWFMLLAIPYCAFGLPRQALCIAAGLGFGLWEGLVFSSLAYGAGALLIYGWVRLLAPARFRARQKTQLESRFASLSRTLNQTPLRAVLTLRLMPVGSALLVSMAAGLFELPPVSFVAATLLGGLPQNMVFVLIGSGTRIGHAMQLGLAGILFVGSGALGAMLLRRNRDIDPVESKA